MGELDERQFLQRHLYEMERDRVMYLLRAYMRTRLRKARPLSAHSSFSASSLPRPFPVPLALTLTPGCLKR